MPFEASQRQHQAHRHIRRDDLLPGTSVSVSRLIQILSSERDANWLFRAFPALDPNDVRDAVDRAAECGLTVDSPPQYAGGRRIDDAGSIAQARKRPRHHRTRLAIG